MNDEIRSTIVDMSDTMPGLAGLDMFLTGIAAVTVLLFLGFQAGVWFQLLRLVYVKFTDKSQMVLNLMDTQDFKDLDMEEKALEAEEELEEYLAGGYTRVPVFEEEEQAQDEMRRDQAWEQEQQLMQEYMCSGEDFSDLGEEDEDLQKEYAFMAEMYNKYVDEPKTSTKLFGKPDLLLEFMMENDAACAELVEEEEFFAAVVAEYDATEEDEIVGTDEPVVMTSTRINLMMSDMDQDDEFCLNLALRFKQASTTSRGSSKLFNAQTNWV